MLPRVRVSYVKDKMLTLGALACAYTEATFLLTPNHPLDDDDVAILERKSRALFWGRDAIYHRVENLIEIRPPMNRGGTDAQHPTSLNPHCNLRPASHRAGNRASVQRTRGGACYTQSDLDGTERKPPGVEKTKPPNVEKTKSPDWSTWLAPPPHRPCCLGAFH